MAKARSGKPSKSAKAPAPEANTTPETTQPKKIGRPSKYTPEIVDEICQRISEGETLTSICRSREEMPAPLTFYSWLKEDEELTKRFARAREMGEDAIADSCFAIANAPLVGEETVTRPNGDVEVRRADMLGHRKLQIETRLKLLAKWNPKKWGEKVDVAHGGGGGDGPVAIKVLFGG